MVCAPVWSIIHSPKFVGYLSVQAQKPCCMSDLQALKEQSDQDLHCLPFCLLLLEALLHCKIKLFYIKDTYGS